MVFALIFSFNKWKNIKNSFKNICGGYDFFMMVAFEQNAETQLLTSIRI